MNREEIVVNGCSGGCCTNFSFPFSLEDFDLMIQALKEDKSEFKDSFGNFQHAIDDNERFKIREMIIPLGLSEIDPQLPHSTLTETIKYELCIPEDEKVTKKDVALMDKKRNGYALWYKLIDGKIFSNTYTCKHYDIINRICMNYENRPNMCKNFGKSCTYKGCGYTKCNSHTPCVID